MGSSAVWTGLVVLAAAMAGCLGGGDAEETGPTVAPPESEAPAANRPPQILVSADPVQGEIPLNVTFQLLGSDPDGDNITWFIDVDDDHASEDSGKSLPVFWSYVFTEAGNHRVRVTVTDGEYFEERQLSILAAAPRVEDHPIDPVVFEGTLTGAWAGDYVPGQVEHPFEVPAVPDRMVAHLDVGTTALDLDYVLWTPNGDWADGRANPNEPTGVAFRQKEPDLIVTDERYLSQLGTWVLKVSAGASVEGDYTITITFE